MAEEGVRVGTDQRLGQAGRLRHQVQVERDRGGAAVQHAPHVQGGQHVEQGEVTDRLRMVEPGPERDQGAPVVPGQREALVAERTGQRHDVGGHRALGVPGAVGVDGLVAVAVPAQVGADDRVVGGQVGRDVPPHEVGLREAVQQHDRAAGTSHRGVERDAVGDGDAPVVESGDPGLHEEPFW
ncbi:hypothetical protein GCM10027614_72640 [Micromonospora vulcania]